MDADKRKKEKKALPTPDVNVSAIEYAKVPDVTLPQCTADRSTTTWTAVIWNDQIAYADPRFNSLEPLYPTVCSRQLRKTEAKFQLHVGTYRLS